MDYKKTNAPSSTVTRDMMELCADTGNVYETVSIIGKRANQISVEIKSDLSKKLSEFARLPIIDTVSYTLPVSAHNSIMSRVTVLLGALVFL